MQVPISFSILPSSFFFILISLLLFCLPLEIAYINMKNIEFHDYITTTNINTVGVVEVVVVVLGFYVSPTAKVIRRRDLGLKSHTKDCCCGRE